MPTSPNILLIGLRGSGKSTIGRELAVLLARPFVDLDDLTAAELESTSAGAALSTHGPPRFRAAEAAALTRALKDSGRVIALGGGTPTAPGAADMIRRARATGAAWVVYLAAAPAMLRSRLAADTAVRPSLTGLGTLEEVEELFAARDPLYRELADGVVDVGDGTAAELAARLAALLASE